MATDFESHRRDANEEDAEFLRRNGLDDEQIAKRLGLKLNTMKRREERNGKSQSA